MKKSQAIDVVVFGVVQGVGFRPFVYRTARNLQYTGWVKNIGSGVEIHLEATRPTDFQDFLTVLETQLPPLSSIENLQVKPAEHERCPDFRILKTREGGSFVFISPDISVCDNCRNEMFQPEDRRYVYPFINCTDCGPRYTIVNSLPYDRNKTTMQAFVMCPDCRKEYENPMDRRYHAQPIACAVCGPQVELIDTATRAPIAGGIPKAAALIRSGKILAVKGLGGFHLVCDPENAKAVTRLRSLKTRQTKPLALMARDEETVERIAHISPREREYLRSARRPIVLLQQKAELPGIAPGLRELGIMLPYTPLHFLLLKDLELIVATSSNRKDSPIMKEEEEGLYNLCDAILTHDRPIAMRADDSVMKISRGKPLFVRRARGYVPYPQPVPPELKINGHILALGAELKDTVSVYKNGYVVTSQFLGDLDEYQNFAYFEETIAHLSRLFEIRPQAVVSDLHPDFHTTRYAQRSGLLHIQVQHHFAHVLATLLEHKIPPGTSVFGVSWDGFGYGSDKKSWGAEFMKADYAGFERLGSFRPVPLPGGDLASKQPWRMALSYLVDVYGEDLPAVPALGNVDPRKIKGVREMIRQKLNTPAVSSCGRFFDAVSFLAGLAPLQVEYEAEAPMRLEAQVDPAVQESYPMEFSNGPQGSYQVSFHKTIRAIVQDSQQGMPPYIISSRFHNTLAEVICRAASKAQTDYGLDTVVLTGGVFLNRPLLEKTQDLLEAKELRVLRPEVYSPNDESISVGQIAYALNQLRIDLQ